MVFRKIIKSTYSDIELEAVDLNLKDSTESSSDDDADATPGQPPRKRFTVEEAVESVGFGFFQIRLFIQCGLFTVSLDFYFHFRVQIKFIQNSPFLVSNIILVMFLIFYPLAKGS